MKTKYSFLLSLILQVSLSFAGNDKYKLFNTKEVDSTPVFTISGWATNTSFAVPMFVYYHHPDSWEKGSLSIFKSSGAGFGLSYGKITYHSNDGSKITSATPAQNLTIDMKNIFSFYIGFLFSIDNSADLSQNSFAPLIYFGVLDLQVGFGYELLDVADNQPRHFMSLSYNVPISKFTDIGSFVLARVKISGSVENRDKSFNTFF